MASGADCASWTLAGTVSDFYSGLAMPTSPVALYLFESADGSAQLYLRDPSDPPGNGQYDALYGTASDIQDIACSNSASATLSNAGLKKCGR